MAMTKSVCEEYRALVDKAYNKFSRLRDFPPYGQNKWDFYFHKAFQVYTKLWKFQQDNRQKLVEAGLKRWEIGEIASRIGQLYYIYYLRTSDAAFLSESYMFYEAILSREYFKDPGKDITLANKQLRYHARFIVICLLLNRWDMVNRLVRQLHTLVEDYSASFQNNQTADAKEWKTAAQEVIKFLKADACEKSRPLRYTITLDGDPTSLPAVLRMNGLKSLKLQNAVLVSYYHNEVKFSELTLDNFRMLQCLEWEPSGSFYRMKIPESNSAARMASEDIVDQTLPANLHKYILYRPTVQQLLLVLATACEELPRESAILLYISASGKPASHPPTSSSPSRVNSGRHVTHMSSDSSMKDVDQSDTSPDGTPRKPPVTFESHSNAAMLLGRRPSASTCLYPNDLLPFTRRPLFIIIDSDRSNMFEVLSGEERGEAVLLLLSPTSHPALEKAPIMKHQYGGNLFTYFLTAPLLALSRMAGIRITDLQPGCYERAEKLLSKLIMEWGNLLSSSLTISIVWARVLSDPFLRQLVLRFIFARACYSLHELYLVKSEYIPKCVPSIAEEVQGRSLVIEKGIFEIAQLLGIVNQFTFSMSLLNSKTTSSLPPSPSLSPSPSPSSSSSSSSPIS